MILNHIIKLWFLAIFISCQANQSDSSTKAVAKDQAVEQFDWLLGNWARKNEEAGKSTFEYWNKSANGEYTGLGYTLQNQDTVFKEELRLIQKEGVWNFEVVGVNEAPTYFVFTAESKQGFVCENPQNEFPKKIEYYLKGKELGARISGEQMKIDFLFEKLFDSK